MCVCVCVCACVYVVPPYEVNMYSAYIYSLQPEGEGSIYMCYTPSRCSIMDLYHDEDLI